MDTSFNSHGNSLGTNYYYTRFTHEETRGTKRLRKLPKVTQLINMWSWNFDQESLNPVTVPLTIIIYAGKCEARFFFFGCTAQLAGS